MLPVWHLRDWLTLRMPAAEERAQLPQPGTLWGVQHWGNPSVKEGEQLP